MPLDPQARTLLDQIVQLGLPPVNTVSVDEARANSAAARALGGPGPEVAKVVDGVVPGPAGDIPVRIYTPGGAAPNPVLVFFHGGGWVIGDLDSHDATCREICLGAECIVVAVHYRLAPESKFPAAAEDAYAALQWAHANAASLGGDASRVAIAGDSAGGNLAAVVTLMARDRGGAQPIFQLLIYPVTDWSYDTASYRDCADGYLLTRDAMEWFWNHYLPPGVDRHDPYHSPLRAKSMSGLPPALVQTAEFDPLRDEGEAYAARLREAGVPVNLTRYDGMIHGFFNLRALLDQARTATQEACVALRHAFGA